ncbi:hypothetical protein RMN64_15690 [Plesiomonas shigelloides]|uniref:hypothetical protein n=1 Tax=Plesiomonas shigelloides TaxID=703 RepID=UPI0028865F8B|nr:hypothetical protein [Plesiomonas shigelloides]MDT1012858.1 hypothetical protein [Plesiomonas shigelloides]
MRYKVYSNPHNALMNLSHYNIDLVKRKVNSNIDDGLGLDCLNCLITLAFSVESIINFIGNEAIDNWKEKMPYHKKIELLYNSGAYVTNKNSEPNITLKNLKYLRDVLAHSKPKTKDVELNLDTPKEINALLAHEWDDFTTPHYVIHAYEMVKLFELEQMEKYGIELWDAQTRAHSEYI